MTQGAEWQPTGCGHSVSHRGSGQLQITNKLRLRRAARGSGEHRRKTLAGRKACRIASKRVASSCGTEAPASQLWNVIWSWLRNPHSRVATGT